MMPLLTVLFTSLFLWRRCLSATEPLTIGLFFVTDGVGYLPSIHMAMDNINDNETILPHYHLKGDYRNTNCQPGKGVQGMIELLTEAPKKAVMIGGLCSVVTQPTAATSAYFNVLQIAPGSRSPALEDRSAYPLLYRMTNSDTGQNKAIVKLFQRFGWTRVATIRQNRDIFALTMKGLIEDLTANNITVLTSETFQTDPEWTVRNVKKKDARIIVAFTYLPEAKRLFCEAYKNGMYGSEYVWVTPGWTRLMNTGDTDKCAYSEWHKAANFILRYSTRSFTSETDKPTVSGWNKETFTQEYHRRRKEVLGSAYDPKNVYNNAVFAPAYYDAVWCAALAMHRADTKLRETGGSIVANFSYKTNTVSNLLKQAMDELTFHGISGQVSFNEVGSMRVTSQLVQEVATCQRLAEERA